jgi:hypothetical protein
VALTSSESAATSTSTSTPASGTLVIAGKSQVEILSQGSHW